MSDKISELEELVKLFRSNAINSDEFQKLKRELIFTKQVNQSLSSEVLEPQPGLGRERAINSSSPTVKRGVQTKDNEAPKAYSAGSENLDTHSTLNDSYQNKKEDKLIPYVTYDLFIGLVSAVIAFVLLTAVYPSEVWREYISAVRATLIGLLCGSTILFFKILGKQGFEKEKIAALTILLVNIITIILYFSLTKNAPSQPVNMD